MTAPARVILADDHPIIRAGIRQLIASEADMTCVAELDNADDLLASGALHAADVLVLDISMPAPPFAEVMRQVRASAPDLRVLVVSIHPEEQYALRALRLGASGYLTKQHSVEEVITAIRHVRSGKPYITRTLAEHLAVAFQHSGTGPHRELSRREYEVFQWLVQGEAVKNIAARLGISAKTVSTYRKRVFEKLSVQNMVELIRYAATHEVLPLFALLVSRR